MNRQQHITREQVRAQINNANARVDRLISQAPHAASDAEFELMLNQIAQGISDAAAWTVVLEGLDVSESVAA